MRMRTSANDRLTVPSSVMASPVVVSPSNVLSPSTGLPERCGTRFFICVIPFPYVPFDCPTVKSSRGRELRIQARRRPQGAPVVLEKDVLVGRVRAGTGVPHAEGYVRHPSGIHTTDRKSTRLNSSHSQISYAVFCLKKKKKKTANHTHDELHVYAH